MTSPDQHKPGHPKAARIGAVVTMVALILMIIGNQQGHVEVLWLIGSAVLLLAILLADWGMRRNGLKP